MPPANTRWTSLAITLVVLAAAMALTVRDVRLASSQTITLVAKRSEQAIPLDDPSADVWKRATTVEVPLSGQTLYRPWREAREPSPLALCTTAGACTFGWSGEMKPRTCW